MYPKDKHSSGNQIPFSSWFNDRFTVDVIITIASMIIWHDYLTKAFSHQLSMCLPSDLELERCLLVERHLFMHIA